MATREQELSTLRKLKQLLLDKEVAEKELEHYKAKVKQLKND